MAGPEVGNKAVVDYEAGAVAGDLPVSEAMLHDARELMDREQNHTLGYDDSEVFVETIAPPPHLVIFGAVHIAQELTSKRLGSGIEWSCPMPVRLFTTPERFPEAAEVLVGWPERDRRQDHPRPTDLCRPAQP